MADVNWPEFLYGGMTVDAYRRHVRLTRDVRSELIALVGLVRDFTEYPFHEHGKTYQYLHRIASAMHALLQVL